MNAPAKPVPAPPEAAITTLRDRIHCRDDCTRLPSGVEAAHMENRYSYSAHAHWTQHKRGILEVAEIPRTINFAAPPEFGGEPGLWTPEHLLVGAVATCYVSTFKALAEHSKLAFHGMDVRVEGTLEKQEGGYRFTRIVLRPSVVIDKAEDRDRAQRLIDKADRACLVSRSLSSEIRVEPDIKVEELAVLK